MKIETVIEYVNAIEQLKKNYTYEISANNPLVPEHKYVHTPKFIYRGHGNHHDYQLTPGVFRWRALSDGHEVSEYSQLEYNILSDFISESSRYIKGISIDDIAAWLEMAQHFGVPTRLLDFTENPLVALYFACRSSSEATASVWVLNESAYNANFFQTPLMFSVHTKQLITEIIGWEVLYQRHLPAAQMHYSQYPVIYRPAYREERMSSQSSVFLLWAADRSPLTSIIPPKHYMSFDGQPESPQDGVIGYIEIPEEAKTTILVQLNDLGINDKVIYPGLDGIGRYIRKKYSTSKF